MADSEAEAAQVRKERREAVRLVAGRERRRTRTLVLTYVFGFLGPALCFTVYWSVSFGPFDAVDLALHIATAVGASWLAVHISRKIWPPRFSAFLGGALFSSALQALFVALCLLPFSLIGLVFVLGALGLIPFGTAWALHRAAREAREVAASLPRRVRLGLATCGFVLTMLLPLVQPTAQFLAYKLAFERLDEGTAEAVERAHEALAWVPWLSTRPLVDEAGSEEDEARFERLSRLYELRFGESIEEELWAD